MAHAGWASQARAGGGCGRALECGCECSAVQLVGTLGLPKGSAAELGHVYGGEAWRVRGCEMGGRLAARRTGAASRGCRAGRAGQRAHKLQSSFQLWALEGATSAVWCRLALAVML